ncbi:MAG: DUF3052 domain-containing protein [Bacteroidota bacterium]
MPDAYTSTPLARKLGLKPGFIAYLHQAPAHYRDLFLDWPADVELRAKGGVGEIDFIHFFVRTIADLQSMAPTFMSWIKKDGLLWVSWPKGKSSLSTDLKRDMIREYLLELGFVDVKVASIDKDWSGLKFVYRLEDRK